MRNSKGFSLIEVMVAVVVLSIGLGALWAMQITSIDSNSRSYFDTTAIFEGTDQIENWMIQGYDTINFNDTNGNGTNVDTNRDGIDNVNSNSFGLNDFPGCRDSRRMLGPCISQAADYTLTVPGAVLHWNVAIDYPVEYTKTIRVHMIRPMAGNRPITFEYIKEAGI